MWSVSGTKLERGQDPWILRPKQCAGVTVSSRASGLGRLALRKLFRRSGTPGETCGDDAAGRAGGGGRLRVPRGPGCPSCGGNGAKGVAPARGRRVSQGGGGAGPGGHGGGGGGGEGARARVSETSGHEEGHRLSSQQ